ncbi:MAG: molybdenum cofactor biosynthesis enzyme MoaA [Myxococcota bacterium]|jgi:molybdenum cofactor biosynthesis enzyme MoaA
MPDLQFEPDARFALSRDKMDEMPMAPEDSIILVLTYRCNSRCRFCIIESEIVAGLPDTSRRDVAVVLNHNKKSGQFKRLILTGAEVTLRPDLAEIAQVATTTGRFETVRIQTNARRLRDAEYTAGLVAAGITEYFVSIHAHTPALDRQITRSSRSFEEMKAGVSQLQAVGASIIANTVICRSNVSHLPDIASFILAMGITELNFWSFLELEGADQTAELIPLSVSLPLLMEALDRVKAAGQKATVKWMPRCLLGRHADCLDNHQPHMFIHDKFQARLNQSFEFRCPHERTCTHFRNGCDGLHQRYIEVFGDESERLTPHLGTV